MSDYIKSDNFKSLMEFVDAEYEHSTVFPPKEKLFASLNITDLENVKVVILGQDPYHGFGQGHGLSFSVADGVKQPPSLRNIVKELVSDIGINPSKNGNLTTWAEQGVLLLNATMSVREKEAGSHQKKGWEEFTDCLIKKISENVDHCVFVLWGNFAQKKSKLIDSDKHLIINSVHPSPLSAHRGFFGSKPFSQTNKFLLDKGIKPINWELPFIEELQSQKSLF